MSYVDEVFAQVAAKNANEPEFIQAVTEVLESLRVVIEANEEKYRKGDKQGKGWRDDWDAMARKTVYRKLIGKWGVMSIEYQNVGEGLSLAQQIVEEDNIEEGSSFIEAETIEVDGQTVVVETGEVK